MNVPRCVVLATAIPAGIAASLSRAWVASAVFAVWALCASFSPRLVWESQDSEVQYAVDELIDDLVGASRCEAPLEPPCRATAAGTFWPLGDVGMLRKGMCRWRQGCEGCASMEAIVAAGPAAIPSLLSRLEDGTLVGVRLTRGSTPVSLVRKRLIRGNPSNELEVRILGLDATVDESAPDIQAIPGEWERDGYPIRLGDLCFELLGQIVNRPYFCWWPEFSRTRVVCSPVDDVKLRDYLRALWGGAGAESRLRASLMADLATEDVEISTFRPGAAVRLVYYFSGQGTKTAVARLLAEAEVNGMPGHRASKNGFWIEDLCWNLYAFSDEEVVHGLRGVAGRAEDERLVAVCLRNPHLSKDAAVREKTTRLLRRSLAEGVVDPLLWEGALRCYPEDARLLSGQVFAIEDADVLARIIEAIGRTGRPLDWLVARLCNLLDDERETHGAAVSPKSATSREAPLRLCDWAAMALAQIRAELQFDVTAAQPLRDAQRERMKTTCSGHGF